MCSENVHSFSVLSITTQTTRIQSHYTILCAIKHSIFSCNVSLFGLTGRTCTFSLVCPSEYAQCTVIPRSLQLRTVILDADSLPIVHSQTPNSHSLGRQNQNHGDSHSWATPDLSVISGNSGLTLMLECRCRTEAGDYRQKCRCRTNFSAFRHLLYIWFFNIIKQE